MRVAVFPEEAPFTPVGWRRYALDTSILHGFLLELLSEALKFSFELRNNTHFYLEQPDGNSTDCFGMVSREEVDIAVCALAINEASFEDFNLSIPYYYSSVTFVTDRPHPVSNKYAMFHPFSKHVWITLIIVLLFMSFFIYYFHYPTTVR